MKLKNIYKKFSFKNISGNNAEGLIVLSQDQIDELHTVLLKIMDDIFLVCDENNLTCFLSGGTALGAVRHQGFIPWDDDADLNMPRAQFEKFIPLFQEKFGDKYWVQTPKNHPQLGMPICRIRKKNTRFKTREDLIDDSEAGAYVDIFIVENIPDNKILRQLHGMLCMLFKICLSCRRFYRDRKLMKQALKENKEAQGAANIRLIVGFLCSFLSVERWTLMTESVFSMCKNDESKQVSIPAGRWHYFGEIYDRDQFCETKPLSFEGREFPVCLSIKEYMVKLYGEDYMVVPPHENIEEHVCWGFDLDLE